MELKKCPFCGGIAKIKECLGDHWVSCSVCGASVGFDLDEKECINSWNRRHLTPAAPDSEGDAKKIEHDWDADIFNRIYL